VIVSAELMSMAKRPLTSAEMLKASGILPSYFDEIEILFSFPHRNNYCA
jgi:hypothetical protein